MTAEFVRRGSLKKLASFPGPEVRIEYQEATVVTQKKVLAVNQGVS